MGLIQAYMLHWGTCRSSSITSLLCNGKEAPHSSRTVVIAGSGASLYNGNTAVCDPPLQVNYVRTGIAVKSDCTEAITQLKAKDVTDCSTLNSTNAPSKYSGNPATPLVTVGSCQVLLIAEDGQPLPCSQVAEYASNLAIACSNSQMGTGGAVHPFKSPDGYSLGAAIVTRNLSCITLRYLKRKTMEHLVCFRNWSTFSLKVICILR